MRNESSITLDEFKEQIIRQIKTNAPSSNASKENVIIKVKLTEDAEPVDFHSLRVIISI
jgi:hypothetical protein